MKKYYFSNLINYILSHPVSILFGRLAGKITNKKLSNLDLLKTECSRKKGLEVGGPSKEFTQRGYCPVYPFAAEVDSVNFSTKTIWEGSIKEDHCFQYAPGKIGYQWIAEGTELGRIETGSYDFLLSCNCLEHIANPLKALKEWHRVVKPGGFLFLILPKKESNFDHKRKITTFGHLLEDYNKNTLESDLTHLPEILQLHDLKRDPPAGSFEDFKKRCEDNFNNRCLHHHVFNLDLLQEVTGFFDMQLIFKESSLLEHFIMVRKSNY